MESLESGLIPRRPDRHFWRCQFERLLTVSLFLTLVGLAVWAVEDGSTIQDELRGWAGLVLGALLMGLRSTWKDPEKKPVDPTPTPTPTPGGSS